MIYSLKRIVIVISLLLPLIGCSSNDPSSTAESFIHHMANGEMEKAGEYATKNTMDLMTMISAIGQLPIDPDVEFHLINEKVDGNKAVVTYIDKNGKEKTVDLVRLDEKWKVHAQKK